MRFLSLGLLGIFATLASAAPAATSHVVHAKRDAVPKQWVKRSKLESNVVLPVRIGLTQRNLEHGHRLLMEVADPDSQKYGQHYSADEVNEIFAPSSGTIKTVREWLESSGIHSLRISQSDNKQWIQFDATTGELEDLTKAAYHEYEHTATGGMTVGCDEYSLPSHVRPHVDYINPGLVLLSSGRKPVADGSLEKRVMGVTSSVSLPPIFKAMPASITDLLKRALGTRCQVAITPDCIKTLYNITTPTKAAKGNELGIFENLAQYYSQTDLNEYFLAFQTINKPVIPIGTHPVNGSVDGGNPLAATLLDAGAESELDIQISYPIIYPQNSIVYQVDDPIIEANYTYEGFFNNLLYAIDGSYCAAGISPLDPQYPNPAPGGYKKKNDCGRYKPANVISFSYGGQEFDLPIDYQTRQCNEYMKLGMQGVSLVFSSGDSGVAGPAGDDNDNGCLGADAKIFSPDFPAGCPYLTAAGATFLPTGGDVTKDQEVAVSRFPSGGGFSNIFGRPSYQSSAVNNYFTKHNPPYPYYSGNNNTGLANPGNGIYNRIGRGYPDISAIGDNVVIFYQGAPTLIGGTSASAPAFAAILNRINEERIAAGKSTVGFVNPTLYKNPQVLHDITNGSNPGCGTDGFAVSEGWDPVTGLGTPNYPAMLKLFLSL
ncbi:putative alkaline serine protease AorO [Aulographum hederae CBS 113979]|uniref:Putative alkaline serine protease AorO n=1 Tax=Aulographum hederae CBS 113979 TaxID=1176131 RepID=A0A6G1HB58_9PEZI|nr:putative alkaline serine protease AorO [Aulographum hederae CBS 113979]